MDELIEDLLKEYENGNKKALGDIFSIKKDYIAKLFDSGVNIKTIKFSLEKELKIIIKDDTFYKWVQRNIKNKKHNASALHNEKNSNENKLKKDEQDEEKTDVKKDDDDDDDLTINLFGNIRKFQNK